VTRESRPNKGAASRAGEAAPSIAQATDDEPQDALLDRDLSIPSRAGLNRAIENRDPFWWSSAMRALKWLAADGQPFECYDISKLGVPDPNPGDTANRWGALFSAAAKANIIEAIGYTQSKRPSRSSGLCRVWRGTAEFRAGGTQ
jgi:hypothetical protein